MFCRVFLQLQVCLIRFGAKLCRAVTFQELSLTPLVVPKKWHLQNYSVNCFQDLDLWSFIFTQRSSNTYAVYNITYIYLTPTKTIMVDKILHICLNIKLKEDMYSSDLETYSIRIRKLCLFNNSSLWLNEQDLLFYQLLWFLTPTPHIQSLRCRMISQV